MINDVMGISVRIPKFCNIDARNALDAVFKAVSVAFPTAQIQVGLDDGEGETYVREVANPIVVERVDEIVSNTLDSCIV